MFRQKFDDVTDCTCRLIPQGRLDNKIFKTAQINNKSEKKQIKQKISLKNQGNNSSNKYDTKKVISAQKSSLKLMKNNQVKGLSRYNNEKPYGQQSSSIQKAMPNQKHNANSPNHFEQTQKYQKHIQQQYNSQNNQYGLKKHNIKTADNKFRDQKISVRNSNKQMQKNISGKEQFMVSNFSNNKNELIKNSHSPEFQKKGNFNLENYYKNVANPYQNMDRNKENIRAKQLNSQQVGKNSTQQKYHAHTRKHNMPKPEANNPNANSSGVYAQHTVHGSLQKPSKSKQEGMRQTNDESRMTFQTTKNINITQSKCHSNEESVASSKNSRKQTNPSDINKSKQYIQIKSLLTTMGQSEMMLNKTLNADPSSKILIQNNSQVYSSGSQKSKQKNLKSNINQQTQQSLQKDEDEVLEQWLKQVDNFFTSKTVSNSSLFDEKSELCYTNMQQSSIQGMARQSLQKKIIQNCMKKDNVKMTKNIAQRLQTFNDLFSNKAECQSMIQEDQNQNQTSQVIMTYKNYLELNGQNEDWHTGIVKPVSFKLFNDKQKDSEDTHCETKLMTSNGKCDTNVKNTSQQMTKFSKILSNTGQKNNCKDSYFTKNFNPTD